MTRARFRGYHTYFPVAEYRRYISILLPVFFCDFKQTLTLNGPANRHNGVEQFFTQSPGILHKQFKSLYDSPLKRHRLLYFLRFCRSIFHPQREVIMPQYHSGNGPVGLPCC